MPKPGGPEGLPHLLLDGGSPITPDFRNALVRAEVILPEKYYRDVNTGFIVGLNNAANGRESSLSYIPNVLPPNPLLTDGIGQAVVYGGTNYEIATVVVKDGKVVEETERKKRVMAPTDDLIDAMRADFDPRASAVALNIGQPLGPSNGRFGELDGTLLLAGVKGQSLRDDMPIGDQIREALGRDDLSVTVANDTVAIAADDGSTIIGTGVNKALRVVTGGVATIYNLESANQTVPRTQILSRVDSLLPPHERGIHPFEKMMAGRYLPMHFNETASGLSLPARVTGGEEMTELANTDPGEAGHLAKALLGRSAILEAAQLDGLRRFSGKDSLTLVGDGSLIWDAWQFQRNLQIALEWFGTPKGAINIRRIEDLPMQGAKGLLIGALS